MKRRIFLFATVFLVVNILLTACGGSGKPIKVRLGTDATFPPFELVDYNKKQLDGFDVELIKAIAAKSNLEVELVNVTFDKLLDGVAQCEYDGAISAITINPDRQKQMKFSNPYLTAGQVIVVKNGNVDITDQAKLAGKVVGAQRGTTSETAIKNISGVKYKPYRAFQYAFEDLKNGLIDAVIADKPLAWSYISKSEFSLKIVGGEFAKEDYAIAVCNQKSDLIQKFNNGITWVKLDGTLDALIKKWVYPSSGG
jgi:polar amino acid transport system substrate-binding protein